MDLVQLIKHPKNLDKETLYDLRSLIALHPYYQTARILLLQNLYLLHDPTFDEELRRAAIYVTDRQVLFDLVEAAHYKHPRAGENASGASKKQGDAKTPARTVSLIDNFLESIPADADEEENKKRKRKPTPADAAVDYVAYLLETEGFDIEPPATDADEQSTPADEQTAGNTSAEAASEGNQDGGSRTISLIDTFLNDEGGRLKLKDEPEFVPMLDTEEPDEEESTDSGYFTETLAKIYVKQGRYDQAIEIIRRLNLNYPKKSSYFADQIRFLEKLILNSKNKK